MPNLLPQRFNVLIEAPGNCLGQHTAWAHGSQQTSNSSQQRLTAVRLGPGAAAVGRSWSVRIVLVHLRFAMLLAAALNWRNRYEIDMKYDVVSFLLDAAKQKLDNWQLGSSRSCQHTHTHTHTNGNADATPYRSIWPRQIDALADCSWPSWPFNCTFHCGACVAAKICRLMRQNCFGHCSHTHTHTHRHTYILQRLSLWIICGIFMRLSVLGKTMPPWVILS